MERRAQTLSCVYQSDDGAGISQLCFEFNSNPFEVY